MKEIKLNLLDYKILSIVYALNLNHDFPNSNGVYKLLVGQLDDETKSYCELPAFSSCISTTSKKVSLKIIMLQRHGFLINIYDEKLDKMFIKITPKGEAEIKQYLSHHKHGFKRNIVKPEISILHIEK